MRLSSLGLALCIVACGPASDDTQGTSEASSGGSTTTAATTTAPTTGATDECGPPPATPTCDTGLTDPHAPLCGARGKDSCDGPLESDVECRWVDTQIVAADAEGCAAAVPAGACIAVSYFGDGCVVEPTCAGTQEGRTLWRFTPECQLEVFDSDLCGYDVLGWNRCTWDATPTDACALPWPDLGPAACNCAC